MRDLCPLLASCGLALWASACAGAPDAASAGRGAQVARPESAQAPRFEAEPWPAADALFHRDPRWRGADAAYSVDLGDGRVLWLFGDSFVLRDELAGAQIANAWTRRDCAMIRNSAALQRGYDPSTASIEFLWRAGPSDWLPRAGAQYFWPLHGLRVPGGPLVLFYSRVHDTPGQGLGFASDGWKAVMIDDPQREPSAWRARDLEPPPFPAGINAAQGLFIEGAFAYGLAVREPGDHAGFALRIALSALARGELAEAELWCGDWKRVSRELAPLPVIEDAAPELSLQHNAQLGAYLHVRSLGFGATTLVLSTAERITGPWSAPIELLRPIESSWPDTLVYAGKAHAELTGADLVLTYASNGLTFARLVADERLYYPRFVRVRIR